MNIPKYKCVRAESTFKAEESINDLAKLGYKVVSISVVTGGFWYALMEYSPPPPVEKAPTYEI